MSDVLWVAVAVVSYLLAGVLCIVVLSSVFSPPARTDPGPLVSRSTPVSPEQSPSWDREIGYGFLVTLWPIALLGAVVLGIVLGLGALVARLRGCR